MPKKQRPLVFGAGTRKCQPRLRMIGNGSAEVNTVRAEQCGSIAVTNQTLLREIPPQRGKNAVPMKRAELKKSTKPKSLKTVTDTVFANVFIETLDASAHKRRFPGERARKGNLVTARVPLNKVADIANQDNVTYIELGEPLAAPTPIVVADKVGPPSPSLRKFGTAAQRQKAADVLIGVIDAQGFDFSHPDFLDAKGKTRFVRIWDQGGTNRPSPKGDTQFDYGSEIRQEHMNAAIAASPKEKIPAFELEAQSQMAIGSHGTHVTSIAAGNRGVCSEAMIAGVLISLTDSDNERRKSFYDSTRIADAVDYLTALAEELTAQRKRPVRLAINVSLGTNGHAHDGSSAISRWIDATMSTPGRCICVAAGNAGQEVAAFEGDSGFVMGRIHTSGMVQGNELAKDIEWLVVGNGIADLSENELEIWYSAQDRFAVQVRPPNSAEWIGPVEPRQFIENQQLKDGSFLSVYNELYHPANGANYISIYLSPFLSNSGVVGVSAGRWIVRLIGREIRDGQYHGWIERDDPRKLGRVGEKDAWRFPSFFSDASNVDDSSVSSLACGQRVLSVANLDSALDKINITSSQGPTRDSRNKPDIAAPGTNIVAAKGFAGPNDLWISMSGTSMASPFVTGVAGLMLGLEPKLTAAQIEGIVIRAADPLPGGSFKWVNDAGFGRINPERCLTETERVNQREDSTK
ncbi:MAG TPA: S8 family serine peptidase [Pyrinomonadaceae bacterium]|nr:S8 family serine peptidase [Pyrinomonadaceae bacterium]